MPFNHQAVAGWPFPAVSQTLTEKDCLFYALSVGMGRDPLDEKELPFVFERHLRVMPTMAAVICTPGHWVADPRTGIDQTRIFHGEQSIEFHASVPVGVRLTGQSRVSRLIDKGAGKGALVVIECPVHDDTGRKLWTVRRSAFLAGEGGFGGANGAPLVDAVIPERAPDHVCDLPTTGQQALLYRLNDDMFDFHADPAVARKSGFHQPILHGLCTYAIAGHALLKTVCGYEETRIGSLGVRFSSPVFPGETIRTEMWLDGSAGVNFRCRVVERDVIVIGSGRLDFK
ncbi:MAG: MaoC/PaaZ C-terminal domain-containing protein [Flavobacteriaceae bacterium]